MVNTKKASEMRQCTRLLVIVMVWSFYGCDSQAQFHGSGQVGSINGNNGDNISSKGEKSDSSVNKDPKPEDRSKFRDRRDNDANKTNTYSLSCGDSTKPYAGSRRAGFDPIDALNCEVPGIRNEYLNVAYFPFRIDSPLPSSRVVKDGFDVTGTCVNNTDLVVKTLNVGSVDVHNVKCDKGKFAVRTRIPGEYPNVFSMPVEISVEHLGARQAVWVVPDNVNQAVRHVKSPAEFFAAIKSNPDGTIIIDADIDFQNENAMFPMAYSGMIDGAGHKLSNLNVRRNFLQFNGVVQNLELNNWSWIPDQDANQGRYASLIGTQCAGAEFINVKISNSRISQAKSSTVYNFPALLCSQSTDTAFYSVKIENSEVYGSAHAGLLTGYATSRVVFRDISVASSGVFSSNYTAGLVVGTAWNSVFHNLQVEGRVGALGIVGLVAGSISSSYRYAANPTSLDQNGFKNILTTKVKKQQMPFEYRSHLMNVVAKGTVYFAEFLAGGIAGTISLSGLSEVSTENEILHYSKTFFPFAFDSGLSTHCPKDAGGLAATIMQSRGEKLTAKSKVLGIGAVGGLFGSLLNSHIMDSASSSSYVSYEPIKACGSVKWGSFAAVVGPIGTDGTPGYEWDLVPGGSTIIGGRSVGGPKIFLSKPSPTGGDELTTIGDL